MFSRTPTKDMSFEDIVNRAFFKQTQDNGQYAKPDVKTAHEAFKAYLNDKTPEHLDAFKKAVAICVEKDRARFDLVQKALDKVNIDNLSVAKFRIR